MSVPEDGTLTICKKPANLPQAPTVHLLKFPSLP